VAQGAQPVQTTASAGWIRIGASVALAIIVGVVVWLIVKDKEQANGPDVPSSTASAVTINTVRALPKDLGHDVYWVGESPVATYEVTGIDRNIFIRYLPPGVNVGDPRPDFLIVGTHEMPGSYSLLTRQAREPGNQLRRTATGGIAVWSDSRPQSVYLAFPRSPDLQIEIYDTSARRARRLAISGAVEPIR
jgi:hypothetical protein